MPVDGGGFVVSPYLTKPLRSLREALETRQASPRRSLDRAAARPVNGLPARGLPGPAAEPQAANPLAPRLAPRRPLTVVTGGLGGPSRGQGRARGGA
jgi:hypothetical protein